MPWWKRKPDKKESRVENLCHLISYLDSIRAFRRMELGPIEEAFRKAGRVELWEHIQPDLEKIVFFPQTLPGAQRLMQVAFVLRRLFPICFFSIVLVVFTKAGFIPVRLSPIVSFLFLLGPFAILIGFIYVDLFIRRVIIQYEREHPNMQSKQKGRIKEVIQTLSMDVAKELKKANEEPARCRMELFFDDYEGMRIVKEIRRKRFRKRYPVYLAVPAEPE